MERFLLAACSVLGKWCSTPPVPSEHPALLPGLSIVPSPDDIVRSARPGHSVVGWKLDRNQRAALLERLEPAYAKIIADHVTLAANVAADAPLPDPAAAEAIGRIDDGRGVEALVVAIDGATDRPGGGTFHLTWSLGPGRRAKESNDALAAGPWQPLPTPIPLELMPARWP
jgi:hypothetical protein